MSILVIYGTSRKHGNSTLLTRKLIEGTNCTEIFLMDKMITPITDLRHEEHGFSHFKPDDDYEEIIQQLLSHDVLIFSTPLYWYGMSGLLKNFIDRWSHSLRIADHNIRESMSKKKAYVIITGGDNPRYEALPLIQQFSHIFQFFKTEFTDYVIGKGNRPGEILNDPLALYHASLINADLRKL